MCPRKVKTNVQDYAPILSKPHWLKALQLAREELVTLEAREKILRESIPAFERLAGEMKIEQH